MRQTETKTESEENDMSTDWDSRKMWFEYITKLNDRDLNRRRASGFTLWALLGVLGILFLKVLESFPLIFASNDKFFLFLVFTSNFFNIVFFLFHIFIIIFVNTIESEERRLMTALSRKSLFLTKWLIVTLKIFGAILNVYIGLRGFTANISGWPYYLFGLYFAIDVVIGLKKFISMKLKYKKKNIEYPEAPEALYLDPAAKPLVSILLLILSLGLFLVLYYSIQNLVLKEYILQNINLIKASFQITITWIIFLLLSIKLAARLPFVWLENLERKILIEGLKSDEIRSLFTKYFVGSPMLEWLNSIQLGVDTKYKELMESLDKGVAELEGIKDIDTKYKYEIEGRKKEIKVKINEVLSEFLKSQREKSEQIKYLQEQSGTTKEEKRVLSAIYDEWSKQLDTVKERQREIGEKFK